MVWLEIFLNTITIVPFLQNIFTVCHVTDLAVVMQRVPNVQIPQNEAERLSETLGLAQYETPTGLKEIVRLSQMARVTFPALASALLLTPHTGQYLSLLLPYGICMGKYNVVALVITYMYTWHRVYACITRIFRL